MSQTDTTIVGALDMARHTDRGILRRSITDGRNRRPRWASIDAQTENDFVKALRHALRVALEKNDHRAVTSCVQTLAVLVGQQMSEDHHLDRLEAGQPEAGVDGAKLVVNIYPARPPPGREIVSNG